MIDPFAPCYIFSVASLVVEIRVNKDLNFKVSPEFHARFKATAALRGIPMVELLREAFECWLKQNGAGRSKRKRS